MAAITIIVGFALICVGVGFKLGTQTESWTPLIPAAVGLLIALAGLLALVRPRYRAAAIHAALVLALIAAIASAARLPTTVDSGSAAALLSQVLVLGIAVVYLALGVRSFLAARRARQDERSA